MPDDDPSVQPESSSDAPLPAEKETPVLNAQKEEEEEETKRHEAEQSIITQPEKWDTLEPLVLAYMLKTFQRIKQNTLKLPMAILVCLSAVVWVVVLWNQIDVHVQTVLPAHSFCLLMCYRYMLHRLSFHSSANELELRPTKLPPKSELLRLLEPYKPDKPLQLQLYASSKARQSSLQRDIRIAERVAKHKREDAAAAAALEAKKTKKDD